jgi:transcription antitermination protein NusB
MISKRKGREIGMQILYAVEVGGQAFEQAVHDLAHDKENPATVDNVDYGRKLAQSVTDHKTDIDARIAGAAENYDFSRLAVVDRLVLSIAIAELLYFPDVPIKVCINEAIDIVKKFSTGESNRFVNGVLDTIARQVSNLPERKDDHAH